MTLRVDLPEATCGNQCSSGDTASTSVASSIASSIEGYTEQGLDDIPERCRFEGAQNDSPNRIGKECMRGVRQPRRRTERRARTATTGAATRVQIGTSGVTPHLEMARYRWLHQL